MSAARTWKVRVRKVYADETNHVVVGEVVEEDPLYLRMRCRAFHFKRPTVNSNTIASEPKVRLFPWATIAYITEMPDSTDLVRARAQPDDKDDVVLKPASGAPRVPPKEGLGSQHGNHW